MKYSILAEYSMRIKTSVPSPGDWKDCGKYQIITLHRGKIFRAGPARNERYRGLRKNRIIMALKLHWIEETKVRKR